MRWRYWSQPQYAMMTSMAECVAIQQRAGNIPTYDKKNMPVRDFIQVINNGESSAPANRESQYLKTYS